VIEKSPEIDKKSLPFIIPIVLILGIFIGIGAVQFNTLIRSTTKNPAVVSTEESKYVNDVYKLLQDKFIGEIPTGKDLDYAKVKGIIDALDSKYTSFLTPEETKAYKISENPNFEGIGISLKFDGENTQVETVLSNYPAEKAGIKSKDIITKVDNESVLGKLPAEIASKIRGKAGTSVKVEVVRSDSFDNLSFDITREAIDIDNISYKKLENGIYRINIYQFVDESPEILNKSWDRIVSEISADKDIKGIVLDLRNNPGGYVFSVKYIMEEFFKNGTTLFKEKQKNLDEVVYKDLRLGKFEDIPLTLIVNEGSASASEIFAGAVQDNKRGEIIGKKTVGKGVEQQLLELDDGSMLVVVFQQWLTPTGRNVTPEDPITPEFEVDFTELDFKDLKDPQLDKAIEEVRN